MTGEELLRRWQGFIARYLAVESGQALILALWAMHTWIYEQFNCTPYLEVYAATRGAGKTRVLEVLQLLVRGPEQMATARIAPIVRLIAEKQSRITLLIDEAEKLGQGALNETRSAIATGYRRGASHPVTTAQGVVRFPTFAPKAFALIGNLQPILRDRAIPIYIKRGRPSADLLAEYGKAKEQAEELTRDLVRFAAVSRDLVHIHMSVPEWLHGRNAEIWAPLWSLAEALKLHKGTIEEVQTASVDLCALKELPPLPSHDPKAEEDRTELDSAERLLADCRKVTADGGKFIPTAELIDRLRAIPTAPWRSWRGKGVDALSLAGLLAHFGVEPRDGQVGTGRKNRRVVRGYLVKDIQGAGVQ